MIIALCNDILLLLFFKYHYYYQCELKDWHSHMCKTDEKFSYELFY